MSRLFLILSALIISALLSCTSQVREKIDGSELRQLVLEAIEGSYDANKVLKGMLDDKHIGKKNYNQLSIDSLYIHDRYYYSILLEYYDPYLNIFAIYDSKINFILLDKSLNGNLSLSWTRIGKRNFVFVQERFLTKDILELHRFSIYEIAKGDANAGLIYRAPSHFKADNDTSFQSIDLISDNVIQTEIRAPEKSGINGMKDNFYFDADTKKYHSKENIFKNYIKKAIREYNWFTTKPQIPAELLDDISNQSGSIQ